MSKIKDYLKEVIAEGKKINWPTRKQAIIFTIGVLVISALVAYYLGLLDFIFSKGLGLLFKFK